MSAPTASSPLPRIISCILVLAGIHASALWPGPQGILHACLVLALVPGFRQSLTVVLWAAAAGWVLEGSMRVYPHMGGTALADMFMALLAWGLLRRVPPQTSPAFIGRLGALVLGQTLLVHLCVRMASGSHDWGTGWLWALLSVPLWGALAFRLGFSTTRR